MEKKLYRDEQHKTIGGVCAGLAEYFGVDISVVRLLFVLALVFKGGGFLIYVILWIVLPKKPFNYVPPVDYTVPPGSPFQSSAPYQPTPVFVPQVKKGPSTASIIGGLVLILLGGGFLLDEFNIIPDWDFEQWWPVILVVIGLVLMLKSSSKPAQQAWQTPPPATEPEIKEEPKTDNPSTEL